MGCVSTLVGNYLCRFEIKSKEIEIRFMSPLKRMVLGER